MPGALGGPGDAPVHRGQEVPSTHIVLVPIWRQGPMCGLPGDHSQASTAVLTHP